MLQNVWAFRGSASVLLEEKHVPGNLEGGEADMLRSQEIIVLSGTQSPGSRGKPPFCSYGCTFLRVSCKFIG